MAKSQQPVVMDKLSSSETSVSHNYVLSKNLMWMIPFILCYFFNNKIFNVLVINLREDLGEDLRSWTRLLPP
jgi:hypothetical protein